MQKVWVVEKGSSPWEVPKLVVRIQGIAVVSQTPNLYEEQIKVNTI